MDDTNDVREDVCRRLMSQDKREYSSILKQCFLPECVIDNDDIWLFGRQRIERALDFTTSICKKSGLQGKPIWDQKKRTLTFTYYRHLKSGLRVTQVTVLHLEPRSSSGETRYWVNKIGDRHINMPWTAWPIIGHIHLYIFRPLFSWMIIGIARVLPRRDEEGKRAR